MALNSEINKHIMGIQMFFSMILIAVLLRLVNNIMVHYHHHQTEWSVDGEACISGTPDRRRHLCDHNTQKFRALNTLHFAIYLCLCHIHLDASHMKSSFIPSKTQLINQLLHKNKPLPPGWIKVAFDKVIKWSHVLLLREQDVVGNALQDLKKTRRSKH